MSRPRSFFLRYLHFCASRMGKALSQETQARLSTQAPLLPSDSLFPLCGATFERVVSALVVSFIHNDKVINRRTKTSRPFNTPVTGWQVVPAQFQLRQLTQIKVFSSHRCQVLVGRSFLSLRLKPKVSYTIGKYPTQTFSRSEDSR